MWELVIGLIAAALLLLAVLLRISGRIGVRPPLQLPRSAEREPTPEPKPLYLDENVQFTVYRPEQIEPLKWYPLLAFAHLSEAPSEAEMHPLEQVHAMAAQTLGDLAPQYAELRQDSAAAVPREGELTFIPEVTGVEFNPPRRSFLWQESVHREEFRLRATSLGAKTARGRLSVFLGSIVLAELPLVLEVGPSPAEADLRQRLVAERSRPYRKIFASYSRLDSVIVDQFWRYARAFGDEYLLDVASVRAGELWNDRIVELIESADVFQLFWSWNALHSRYVRTEWEYALTLNRPRFIRPVYWEQPMPRSDAEHLPPDALARINFTLIPAVAALSTTDAGGQVAGRDILIAGRDLPAPVTRSKRPWLPLANVASAVLGAVFALDTLGQYNEYLNSSFVTAQPFIPSLRTFVEGLVLLVLIGWQLWRLRHRT